MSYETEELQPRLVSWQRALWHGMLAVAFGVVAYCAVEAAKPAKNVVQLVAEDSEAYSPFAISLAESLENGKGWYVNSVYDGLEHNTYVNGRAILVRDDSLQGLYVGIGPYYSRTDVTSELSRADKKLVRLAFERRRIAEKQRAMEGK